MNCDCPSFALDPEWGAVGYVPVLQHSPKCTQYMGHSCKIGNMRCPGTLKNQNPQFEEKK